MTPRPRGKRDQRPSPDSSRAPKSGSGKRSGRKPSGKASQRPPRVSRPPSIDEAPKKPTRAPAKPAAAPVPAPRKPAPRNSRARADAPIAPPPAPMPPQQQRPHAPVNRPPQGAPQQAQHAPPQRQYQQQRPPQGQSQNQHQYQNQRPQPQMQRPPQGQHAAPPQQGRPMQSAPNQPRPAQGYGPPPQQGQRPQGAYPNQQSQNQQSQNQHQQNQRPQHPQHPHNQQRPPMQGGGGGGQRPPAPYQNPQQGQRPPAPQNQHGNNQQGYAPQRPQQNYAPQPPQQRPPPQPYQQPPQQHYQQPSRQQQYQQPPQQPQRPPQNLGYAPAQSPRPPQHPPQQPQPPQQQPPQQSHSQQTHQQRPPQQAQPQPPRQSQPQNYYTPAPRPAPQPPAPQPPAYQAPAPQPQAAPPPPAQQPAAPQHVAPPRAAPHPAQPPAPQASAAGPGASTNRAPKPPRHVSTFNQKAIDEIFDKATRFADLGLSPEALQGVTDSGFEFPTSIQARIIPLLLAGKDVLGQAKTGTGKTAAFGLPLLTRIKKGDALSAIILVPTRELAIQVATDITRLGKHCGLTVLPVYGGQNITTQAQRLQRGPEIIVATPGRLMDMRERGYVHYNNIKVAILDEVDRMLDIGFRDDIKRILGSCPKDRQTVFVSATLPSEVEALARTYARDAEKIVATSGSLTASMVQQYHLPVEAWDKKQLLLHLLTHESPALTIVFCRTKRTVDNLAEYLFRKGIDAHAIHGDMYQAKRNQVIEKLKSGSLSVLIASDLASRGLDVEGISHVINYDLPDDPDLYIHRIGRTARAGRDGVAWSLVTPEQGGLLTEIEMLINAEIPKLDYPDFRPGPLPADVAADRAKDAARRTDGPKQVSRFAVQPVVPTAVAATATAAAVPVDAARFPGGIVPSKLPDRRLGGKVRSARSMRNAPPVPVPAPVPPSAGAPAPSIDPASQPPGDGQTGSEWR